MNVEITPDAAMAATLAVDELQEMVRTGVSRMTFDDQGAARDLLYHLVQARAALEAALAQEGRVL